MTEIIHIETPRLRLRQWIDADLEPFAALNADPAVMEFFVSPLKREASDAMARRLQSLMAERGLGHWAVEERASARFLGFVGLHCPAATLPCSPCVEIGWRLGLAHWGQGFASEAASAVLEVGFKQLGLPEIVSFTATTNLRSQAVMRRIGMVRDGGFDHPNVPEGHHLRPHVLYRARAPVSLGGP